jgi:uncharacterized membrane protein
MSEFYGHRVPELVLNIVLALAAFIPVMGLRLAYKQQRQVLGVISWALYLLFAPNALYAALEIKHLVMIDRVADSLAPEALLVFGGISLIGWLATIVVIMVTTRIIPFLRNRPYLGILLLSLHQAAGASIGLLDVSSWDVFMNPMVLHKAIYRFARSETRVLLAFVLGGLLYVICLNAWKWYCERKALNES